MFVGGGGPVDDGVGAVIETKNGPQGLPKKPPGDSYPAIMIQFLQDPRIVQEQYSHVSRINSCEMTLTPLPAKCLQC